MLLRDSIPVTLHQGTICERYADMLMMRGAGGDPASGAAACKFTIER
jgi:hypothetical protein